MDNKLTLPEISPEFKPNYSFVETREITITDWFKTFFVTFALYRARQRIPKIENNPLKSISEFVEFNGSFS